MNLPNQGISSLASAANGATMRVLPIDPIERVTGSCYLVHLPERDLRILVDCGAYQDGPSPAQLDDAPFPFDPTRIHAVLLTHGHYDHCGRLPHLVQGGFVGQVIAAEETIAIAKIVLEDALKHCDRPELRGAYGRIHWRSAKNLFVSPLPIATDVVAFAQRSAHILGAVSWEIVAGPKERPAEQVRVLFSGDIGNNRNGCEVQPMLGRAMGPTATVDLTFVESTYGGTRRPAAALDPDARRRVLAAELQDGIARHGPIIIPVFGIQRAQDVLWDLHMLAAQNPELLDGIPILVDAPMALRCNVVLREGMTRNFISSGGKVRPAWLGKHAVRELGLDPDQPKHMSLAFEAINRLFAEAPAWVPGAVPSTTVGGASLIERFQPRWARVDGAYRATCVAEDRPRIVLVTSGTADGGPVQSWLARWLKDPRATVLFAGYCPRGTLGASLLRIGSLPPSERQRLHEQFRVNDVDLRGCDLAARVVAVSGYSAHADQDGLVEWVYPVKDGVRFPVARRLMITHGDASARRCLQLAIQDRATSEGFKVEVLLPQPCGDAIDARTGVMVSRDEVLGRARPTNRALLQQIEALAPEERKRLLDALGGTGMAFAS
jgi:metallo-beta-lactamase family protein